MDNYAVIICVAFAIVIVVSVIAAIVKTGKKNDSGGVFKGLKDFLRDEPSEHEKPVDMHRQKDTTTIIKGAAKNVLIKNGWKVELVAKADNKILSEGFFNKESFEIEQYDEEEKHYTIGRSGYSNLVVTNVYKDVGTNHGYIRYDLASGEYVYWDNKSKFGTYTDENSSNPIDKYHITIYDGLLLYISTDVYLKFIRIDNQQN